MINKTVFLLIIALLSFSLTGCFRGQRSKKPPVHLNTNMDSQGKYKSQSQSRFFINQSTMRMPVEGTISRGNLNSNISYFYGKDQDGNFVNTNPEELTDGLLARGQERYNIYCVPCHSAVGDGKGNITKYEWPIPPTSFHLERIRSMPDGQLFDVISNGIRNMASYKHQISVKDRWSIIAYVRSLQSSQALEISELPEKTQESLK